MKLLSIFVGLFAFFIGLFVYKLQVSTSPKISPWPTRLTTLLHAALHDIGQITEDLGLVSRIEFIRASLNFLDKSAARNLEDESVVEDSKISGVPVKIFRPRNGHVPLPGLIYLHGGGLVLFTVNTTNHQSLCSKFANTTNSIVIMVDYRLAPEHLFPAQFDDSYAVVKAVIDHPGKFGIIKGKLAIAGDSSGGLISAAISTELAQRKQSSEIAAQILIYPWLQLLDVTYLPSYQEYAQGFLLTREMVAYFAAMATVGKSSFKEEYLSGNISRYFMCTPYWTFLDIPKTIDCDTTPQVSLDPKFVQKVTNPNLSPLLAENFDGLPQTLIVLPEYDVFVNETEIYASRLKKSGVEVVVEKYMGAQHGFLAAHVNPSLATDMVKKAMHDIINYLNFVFK